MDRSAYPDVFTKPPQQPGQNKPGQLTSQQLDQFFSEGYLLLPDFFKPNELGVCIEGFEEYVDRVAEGLYSEGKIKDLCTGYDLWHRLTELRKIYPDINTRMLKQVAFTKNLDKLFGHEKLLTIMEQLVGPNVGGHPTWNIRYNTPDLGDDAISYVPWHQDSAYITDVDARDHLIVTAWIPFQDTGKENGGLMVIPKSHRKGYVATHEACFKSTQLLFSRPEHFEKELGISTEDAVTCEVPRGGVLLFSNILMHCSIPNKSDKVRWSTDLRYQSTDYPWGYYGIEGGVKFMEGGKKLVPDYEGMLAVNRPKVWKERYFKAMDGSMEDDDIITGPWLKNWEHTSPNKHTRAFQKFKK